MTPNDVAPHVHVTVRIVPLPTRNVPTTIHLHERPMAGSPADSLTISMRVRKAVGVAGSVATRQTIARPDSPPPLDTGVL
jgi:hypothetical protein